MKITLFGFYLFAISILLSGSIIVLYRSLNQGRINNRPSNLPIEPQVAYACPIKTDNITGVMQWNDGWPMSCYPDRATHHENDQYQAIDINAYFGSAVLAPASGSVYKINTGDSCVPGGAEVVILGNDGHYYAISHTTAIFVSEGQAVTVGQPIGKVVTKENANPCDLNNDLTDDGCGTGLCTKVHIHFDVYGGTYENPQDPTTLQFVSDNCGLGRPEIRSCTNPADYEYPDLPTVNCVRIHNPDNPNIMRCFEEAELGYGFGLGQVTSPYVARLTNLKDFIDSTSINDLKAITHPVTHSCVAGSLATLQELADRAVSEGVTCDYLTYNLDGQWTPPEEFDNFQQSIETARGIADAHSMKLAVGPGMQFMQEHEELYPAAAAIADAWMISAHVFQVYDIPGYKKTPAEFAADVKHVADILRAAHSDIVVWAQMAIIPGGMVQNLFSAEEMVTYAQAIEAEVEAVRIYLGQLPEAEPVFRELMDLVRPADWCPDADRDGRVGLTDINLILNSNQWNQPYSGIDYLAEDVNRDWRIDILDINQVISNRNWNGECGS